MGGMGGGSGGWGGRGGYGGGTGGGGNYGGAGHYQRGGYPQYGGRGGGYNDFRGNQRVFLYYITYQQLFQSLARTLVFLESVVEYALVIAR